MQSRNIEKNKKGKSGFIGYSFFLVIALFIGFFVVKSLTNDNSKTIVSIPFLKEKSSIPFCWEKALQGDAESQYFLAEEYFNGSSAVYKNEAEAAKWYLKSAKNGYTIAQLKIAQLYEKGIGLGKNETEALRWYQEAANRGDNEAKYNVSIMYIEGRGIEKKENIGLKLMKELSDNNYEPAYNYLLKNHLLEWQGYY